MTNLELPTLPAGVKYLGRPEGPDEASEPDGGLEFKVLWARYEISGLSVRIGWTVDHMMGSFRAPNRLHIDFDSFNYGTAPETAEGFAPEQAFDGITTHVLRSVPMAHARALMRERYEQLFVLSLHEALSPLPTRVESDRDYVHVAMAYVALVNGGSIEPLKRLSEWTNESDDTWSARLRRARTRGVLLGKGRQAELSPKCQKVADEIWSQLREAKGAASGGH
ncbi:hypothetical protein [Arthrobacter sp. CAN_A1]|uniref:hypothetical protein n=1 Tax=Arthrobacter sp. CAN_A1 TaxID=2787717 RepID=UPI0018C9D9E2